MSSSCGGGAGWRGDAGGSARRVLRAAYWTATFQLPRRLDEWRAWRKARPLAVAHDPAVAQGAERVPSLPSPEAITAADRPARGRREPPR